MQKLMLVILLPLVLHADELFYPKNVQLNGELETRVRLTEKRFMHEPFDLDLIVQDVARKPDLTRRFEEYEGDVSGRVLGSWSYVSRLLNERPDKLDQIFKEILKHQSQEGYFGKDQEPVGWDFWGRQIFGHGRLLGGLVQYFHLTKDERALSAATQLGDYFVQQIPRWTAVHEENPWSNTSAWVQWQNHAENRQHFVKTHMTSILESLMMLYEINPQPTYLDAGKKIIKLFPEFGHYHSHSYMNTMTGMAMLYEHTNDHDVLNQLYNLYWQDVLRHGYTIDGGMREWFPDDHRTEGCSITDWIRLNLYMWNITQDAVYLDEAENAWYNGLNFHQTANGAFGHAVCSPNGYESAYSEAWWCCTMHGLWAYAELVNFAAVASSDELWFNFYAPMSFELKGISFTMQTEYPQQGRVHITCNEAADARLLSHVRIPAWVEQFDIKLDGVAIQGTFEHGVFTFEHAWQKDDKLEIEFPLHLRVMDERGNNVLHRRVLGDAAYPGYFYYGPLLLVSQSSGRRGFADEVKLEPQKNYQTPVPAKSFVLSDAHFTLPAMFDGVVTTVHLAPLSEQTGYDEWSDDWNHFVRNGEKPIQRVPVQLKHHVRIHN